MTAAPTRRIRVDVEIAGGRVRMDLTDPTDEQLAAVNALLERWLDDTDDEASEEPGPAAPPPVAASQPTPPADTPRVEPIRRVSPPGPPPASGKRALCGAVEPESGRKCRRYEGHDDTEHRWWERNGARGAWNTSPEPEPDAVALQLGDTAPLADQITEHAATSNRTPTPPGVVLCGCGHGERMHERDELVGRGQCHHAACGCSEYRGAA